MSEKSPAFIVTNFQFTDDEFRDFQMLWANATVSQRNMLARLIEEGGIRRLGELPFAPSDKDPS